MNLHTDVLHDPAHAFMPYPKAPVPHAATGPLAGLDFGVKDLFHVAGYPTSGGQPLLLALLGVQDRTAPTVRRLLDAGARFAGKTVTDELAFSMNGQNAHFGSPVNGAAPDRICGGSSSGSASAVSNRLCDFALGTDTGGSVRAPASHCGLVGLRPTHGRISLHDVLDLAPSLDTCGWFARDVATFARVADVLLGDDAAPLPANVRLLAPTDLWPLATPAATDALAPVRRRIEDILGPARPVQVVLQDLDTLYWRFRHLQGHESWQTDGPFLRRFAPPLGPGVAQRFAWSAEVTDAQVLEARAYRERFRAQLADLLEADGVLLMPTMPDIAPLANESEAGLEDYRNRAIRLLCSAGLSGFPQLTLPLARRDGAPLGISLLGPAGSDRSLVRLAERIAQAWA
ncbi:amidase [Ramlibacter pallidus]|uniref:Amidase n=1 Tax=Ramlibacter pallidus TaxID=2780087 RepID=A0ABR9S2C0_9BURK|nr:amidase [Ramlibacter pallidus]MBE7367651.1 amidase [Ramlibacter pallidus]